MYNLECFYRDLCRLEMADEKQVGVDAEFLLGVQWLGQFTLVVAID